MRRSKQARTRAGRRSSFGCVFSLRRDGAECACQVGTALAYSSASRASQTPCHDVRRGAVGRGRRSGRESTRAESAHRGISEEPARPGGGVAVGTGESRERERSPRGPGLAQIDVSTMIVATKICRMSLREEIRQTRPFASAAAEAYVALLRTSDLLLREFEDLFRRHGLTAPRYNVLRILRGAGSDGLPCAEVSARMVTRAPDMTRLLDGLERDGLAARRRGTEDRRVVHVTATAKALRLLGDMDREVEALHERQLRHVPRTELRELLRLLEKVRDAARS